MARLTISGEHCSCASNCASLVDVAAAEGCLAVTKLVFLGLEHSKPRARQYWHDLDLLPSNWQRILRRLKVVKHVCDNRYLKAQAKYNPICRGDTNLHA